MKEGINCPSESLLCSFDAIIDRFLFLLLLFWRTSLPAPCLHSTALTAGAGVFFTRCVFNRTGVCKLPGVHLVTGSRWGVGTGPSRRVCVLSHTLITVDNYNTRVKIFRRTCLRSRGLCKQDLILKSGGFGTRKDN